jgi:hypothetical protein
MVAETTWDEEGESPPLGPQNRTVRLLTLYCSPARRPARIWGVEPLLTSMAGDRLVVVMFPRVPTAHGPLVVSQRYPTL